MVTMLSVEVAGFVPGVTVAALKANELLAGSPVTERLIGFVNALFTGVTVIVYGAT